MGKQDYENKKLMITKFSFFLQTLNSNFRLSAKWHSKMYIWLDNWYKNKYQKVSVMV